MFSWFFPFIFSFLITKLTIALTKRVGRYHPISSAIAHSHKANTPSMGGISIFASFILVHFIALVLGLSRPQQNIYYVCTVCFLVGLADDIRKISTQSNKGLRKRWKFITLAAALMAYFLLIGFNFTDALFKTAVVLLGAATADILDGLDGLLAMCSIISLIALGNTQCKILAGSILGFLYYNIRPAQIFMGDSGSMFIGCFISCLLLDKPVFSVFWGGMFLVPLINIGAVGLKLLLVQLKLYHGFFKAPLHHFIEEKIGEPATFTWFVAAHSLITIIAYNFIKGA